MILWLISFIFFGLAIHSHPPIAFERKSGGLNLHRRVGLILSRMRESLESGSLIQDSDWERLAVTPAPWGPWVKPMLQELRASGISMIPTLKRLGGLADFSYQDGLSSRSKSAQAFAQSILAMCLIPILGVLLYWLLPELEASQSLWWGGVGTAVLLSGFGALWMKRLTEDAQYLGLKREERQTLFLAHASVERLLAGLGSGTPADLAWAKMVEMWGQCGGGKLLLETWGRALWSESQFITEKGVKQILERFGGELKRGIQVALLEGKPVTERIELVSHHLRSELRGEVDRRIQMLGNHLLLPLFLCVAPAAFGVLAFALYLAIGSSI